MIDRPEPGEIVKTVAELVDAINSGGGNGFPDPSTFPSNFAQLEWLLPPFTLPQFPHYSDFTGDDGIAEPNFAVGEGISDGFTVIADGWYMVEAEVDFTGTETPFEVQISLHPSIDVAFDESFSYSDKLGTIYYPAGTDLNNEFILFSSNPFPAIAGSNLRMNLNAEIVSLNESYARLTLRKIG